MVRQRQLVHTWLSLSRRLGEATVRLRVVVREVGLRQEHDAFWAIVNALPLAAQGYFLLRVDAEHVLQQKQPKSDSEVVELAGAGGSGADNHHVISGRAILEVGIEGVIDGTALTSRCGSESMGEEPKVTRSVSLL